MAERTNIAWCDATVNFWHGCKKVSEGCKYCYMFRDKERWHQDGNNIVKTGTRTITSIMNKLFNQRRDRLKEGNTEPIKIFTCSWSDFFIQEADNWREEAWNVIRANSQFIWIILTKRPERIQYCLPKDWGEGWPNVWLCVSAENQERANERIPILMNLPAKVRGVSCEPLLGPIDLTELEGSDVYGSELNVLTGKKFQSPGFSELGPRLDWIIVGGESGNDVGKWKYRACELAWIQKIVEGAKGAKIPVFVKQMGTALSTSLNLTKRHGDDVNEFPADLQIQEFPIQTATA